MKHLLRVVAVLLIFLSGCRARTALSTPAFSTRQPTVQQQNTPLPSATFLAITATPVVPLPTVPPTQTPTPAFVPTAALEELPQPEFSVPTGSASAYRLAKPDPETLLGLIDLLRQRERMIGGYISEHQWVESELQRWQEWQPVVSDEHEAIWAVEAQELDRAYPTGLPDPEIVLQETYTQHWTTHPFIAPTPGRLVIDALLHKINRTGIRLEAGNPLDFPPFQITALQAELDSDPDREWILFLDTPYADFRNNGLQLWQAVDEDPNASYQTLGNPVLGAKYRWSRTFAAQDFTGDGLTDLLTIASASGLGQTHTLLNMVRWDVTGFQPVTQIGHWSMMGADVHEIRYGEPYFKLLERPGELPGLRVLFDEDYPWGCVYQRVQTFHWPDGQEQRTERTTSDPYQPDCLLAHFMSGQDNAAVLKRLETALSGFNPENLADWPKISFAHYQMAIFEAILGHAEAARQHLNLLIKSYEGDTITYPYLQAQAAPLLQAPDLYATDLCHLGYAAPEDVFSTWRVGLHAPFSDFGGPFPEDICSPSDVVDRILQEIDGRDPALTAQTFADHGLHVKEICSFRPAGMDLPIWLVMVDEDLEPFIARSLYGFVPRRNGFRWTFLYDIREKDTQDHWFIDDFHPDGTGTVALLTSLGATEHCLKGETEYLAWIAGRFQPDAPHHTGIVTHFCIPITAPIQLEQLLVDQNSDGISDPVYQTIEDWYQPALALPKWPEDGIFWFTRSELYDRYANQETMEEQLIVDSYTSRDPAQTRSELLDLQKKLVPNLQGRNGQQQIDYLIAVTYEMEGQEEEAIRRYLALAQETPPTLWAYLAAIKITPR